MKAKVGSTRHILAAAIISLAVLLMGAFSYGVLVGKYRVFPYRQLFDAKRGALPNSGLISSKRIETSLQPLQSSVYKSEIELAGSGGGLAMVDSVVIGVDNRGHFFRYEGEGGVTMLPISIDRNEDRYAEYFASVDRDSMQMDEFLQRFRTHDIDAKEEKGRVVLYASYDHWDADRVGKTTRVARLVLDDGMASLRTGQSTNSSDWQVIYETDPLLAFDLDPFSPFLNWQSGGRIVIMEDRTLLVTIGDHKFDGVHGPDAPQNETNSYGKTIRIDLETLASEVFTLGHRNPQGLMVDREGNIWETEHGPRGGDELNLLIEGYNYGWPVETYGTAYTSNVWPLSPSQGRHDRFQKPVFAWVPSIAVSNLIQISHDPELWDGDLLLSSLKEQSLYRVRLDDRCVKLIEPILIGERIRDLVQMPDGTILLWTDTAHFVELSVDLDE